MVLSYVENTMERVRNVDEILVTGHSLGGAVASMLGVLISERFPDVITRVVTFGSPTPGNIQFQRLFNFRKSYHNLCNVKLSTFTNFAQS